MKDIVETDVEGVSTPRYDLGLKKVLSYARARSADSEVASAISFAMAKEIIYDPSIGGAIPPDQHVLYIYTQGRALCKYNAALHEYLAEVAGLPASVFYLWGGATRSRVDYYQYAAFGNWVSFRAVADSNDVAEANPHFTYHAQTRIGSVWYDPSYGKSGLVSFSELCPAYSQSQPGEFHYPPEQGEMVLTPIQQIGSAWPPSEYVQIPYLCGH